MIVPVLILAAMAFSGQQGGASPMDPRVQLLSYDADRVVPLPIDAGYAAVVELGRDEAIQNVVVGNSAVWQVTASGAGDRVVVKPLAGAIATNMIIVTDLRRYIFLLQPAEGGGQGLFAVRFTYPETPAPAAATQVATYRFGGAKTLFPSAMRDDGKRTTITWGDHTALPAVFAESDKGGEAAVNGRMVGRDYVIEGTSRRYVFRLGEARAVASRKLLEQPQ